MPRAKDTIPGDSTAKPETGFAALEAKVEEIQALAAIEAEAVIEDAPGASPTVLPEEFPETEAAAPATVAPAAFVAPDVLRPEAALAPPSAGPAAAVKTVLSVFQENAQETLRFQAETIACFSQVRGPQDLLAAQVRYGEGALALYMAAMTRMAQALPAFRAG